MSLTPVWAKNIISVNFAVVKNVVPAQTMATAKYRSEVLEFHDASSALACLFNQGSHVLSFGAPHADAVFTSTPAHFSSKVRVAA
jgi:hypothetical protein